MIYGFVFDPEVLEISWTTLEEQKLTRTLLRPSYWGNLYDSFTWDAFAPRYFERLQRTRYEVRRFRRRMAFPSTLNLILTSRQMHHEAIRVFYKQIKFRFYECEVLHSFLSSLNPASKAAIRNLEIMYYPPGEVGAYETSLVTNNRACYRTKEEQKRIWDVAFQKVAEVLKGLRHLTLFIYSSTDNFNSCLTLGKPSQEEWAIPLARLKGHKLLQLDVFNHKKTREILSLELLGPERGAANILRLERLDKSIKRDQSKIFDRIEADDMAEWVRKWLIESWL